MLPVGQMKFSLRSKRCCPLGKRSSRYARKDVARWANEVVPCGTNDSPLLHLRRSLNIIGRSPHHLRAAQHHLCEAQHHLRRSHNIIGRKPTSFAHSATSLVPCGTNEKSESIAFGFLAGVVGLEPTNAGVKVLCLTTWRHPKI